MKKFILPAVIAAITFVSCAQKEEKREEYKEDHYKNEMVNNLGDSAVAATDSVSTAPTPAAKSDTLK